MEQNWNRPFNIKRDIEGLKSSKLPVIIYSLTEESEAIANSCRENNIKVSAFCDNEIRKTNQTRFNHKVIYTPDLPKHFSEANFIIGHHTLDDCAEQLTDLGYNNFYSPLNIFKNYQIDNYSHKISQSYMKKKLRMPLKSTNYILM